MLKNYAKIAFRNIWNNKVFSAINIVGLAVGMASCLVIMLFVFYEKSFDKMHAKNIYRLNEIQKFDGTSGPQKVAISMPPMGATLKNEYPEVLNFTRVNYIQKAPLSYKNNQVELPSMFCVDSAFLKLFDFKVLRGNAFKEPNSLVLSQKSAENIFGKEDPIGKFISYFRHDTLTFKVTGIIENIPYNSHLQFDGLVLLDEVGNPEAMNRWDGNWLVTYLEIAKNTDIQVLESKFPAYLKKYMGNDSKHYELFLQPLNDIHAKSSDIMHDYINFQKFDQIYIYVFSVIAIIVLVIACVNFMNLSTARSTERAKEVGIRKSIGAQRFQLACQFIGESVLLSLIAFLIAIFLTEFSIDYVIRLSGRKLSFDIFSSAGLIVTLLVITVLVGMFSGLYPAVFLSSFEAIKVLKGALRIGKSNLRSFLVVIQFTCAICLIITTAFVVKQLQYMRGRNPGFDKEQVVVIPLNATSCQKYHILKQEMLASPFIAGVSASRQRLGNNLNQTGIAFKGTGPTREISSSHVVVDPDYLSLYKIELKAGRNFRDEISDNGRAYIINETLARELLKEEPKLTKELLIGKRFGFDSLGTIVGISKDFNFNSFHHSIEPLFLYNQKNWAFRELSVRIKEKDTRQAIAALKSVWDVQLKNQPFTYSFLDQHFAELYKVDSQVSKIVGILAALAIFVSCLGLFGLASYSAERRVKEIGVRKVMGASVAGIVALLSRDFIKLVLVSILIASPVAWWAVSRWLQDFAYRIDIEWSIFAIAGILAICIALLTVSFQSIKAALMNPVKSLRSE